ncbi:hypothetical protein [Nostoc sp.]
MTTYIAIIPGISDRKFYSLKTGRCIEIVVKTGNIPEKSLIFSC